MKLNPIHEQKITQILSKMTIEEKVLQMLQISEQGNAPETYEKFTKLFSKIKRKRVKQPKEKGKCCVNPTEIKGCENNS